MVASTSVDVFVGRSRNVLCPGCLDGSDIGRQQYSATIGDLSTFIDNAQLDQTGMYDSRYLAPLFAGNDMD